MHDENFDETKNDTENTDFSPMRSAKLCPRVELQKKSLVRSNQRPNALTTRFRNHLLEMRASRANKILQTPSGDEKIQQSDLR
jgi:hypothetical protein